jgi:hypothetical protein
MARSDERRSKHCQGVSASSSGPSVKLKKLAKRLRPHSYQEESSLPWSTPIKRSWIIARRISWMWCISATSLAIAHLWREAPMKDFGLSFIKIGTELCFIWNLLQWSSNSMLILSTWGTRACTSTGYLKLVTYMVSLICCSLGTTRIKKSSQSYTPLSSMTRKRGSLCGWLMAKGSMWS